MKLETILLTDEGEGGAYLDAYLPDPTANFVRKPLLVIPGGGYGKVCADREGEPIAQAFLPYGYSAFVLHYTVGRKKPFPAQLTEATLAIKYIKDHAKELGVDADELFVVGFSAGGHLAASTGVLWKNEAVLEAIPMPHGYNKPTGVMLIYPVISPDYEHHIESFRNLWCSDTPTEEQLHAAAIERHVDADSAPAFILHGVNDQTVDVRNSLTLANAYALAEVPFEMHIYPNAPHGLALANAITAGGKPNWIVPAVAEWVRLAANWAETV